MAKNASKGVAPIWPGSLPDKWAVLLIMLLLLMMPMAYLFTVVADEPRPAEWDPVSPPAARAGTVMPPVSADGSRHESDRIDAINVPDPAGMPATLKLDPRWHAERKNKVAAKKLAGHAADVRKNKRVAAAASDSGARESTAGGDPPPEAARSRAAPVAAVESKPATEAARDIVTRAPSDSIDALVGRCRALGLIEGELCRLRICAGLWGKEPACGTSAGPALNQLN